MSVDRRRSSVVQVDHGDDGVLRVPDDAIRRLSVIKPDIGQEQEHAQLATDFEKSLTVRQALRLYKRAVLCSAALSLAVVMEGYDLSAIGGLLGFDAFRQQFGTELDPEGNPRISAAWQAGIQNGTQVGSIIGLYINGYLSEWLGYKRTMYISVIACACFNFIHFFSYAGGVGMVCAGSVLMGVPFGIFQTLTVTYASDITPVVLRPYLTTYVNLCWVMGQLVSAGVLRGTLPIDSWWAWRIPIAVQWAWLPFVFLAAVLAPESPWWCVRKGRFEQARESLLKCTSQVEGLVFNPDHKIAMIKHTNDLEEAMHSGVGYLDCFKGVELRRTVIACMVWLAQAFCGAALMGYSVQIYREAGLSEEGAFNLNIGQYALGFCGTVASWFLMKRIGRRPLYVWGHAALFCLLLVIGGLGVISRSNTGAAWALGSVLLVYTVIYDLTVGPVCYALVAEISSTRLKIKTVVLARNLYNVGGLINNALVPRMLSPTDWNWAGMTGFFYAGLCAILFIYFWFCLPETKDRAFAELDILFENHVPARKFRHTNVDQFSGATTEIQLEQSDSNSNGKGNAQAYEKV